MNQKTYEVHAAEACRKGLPLDPLIAMAFYRNEMRSQAARKYGAGPSKRAYRDLRLKVSKPSPLPRDIRPASNVHPLFQNMFRTMGLAA